MRAWIDQLVQRGFQRVVVAGHSMGGVKAVYSQARDAHPNVVSVIGISPPRFCHSVWQTSSKAAAFRDHFQHATELVARGRGGELMMVQQPMPLWLTASGFLAKYGAHDDYDFVPLLPQLKVPTLIMVGGESVASSPAFESTPDAIGRLLPSNSSLKFQLVPAANIVYSGQVDVPARLARDWFASVVNSVA